MARILIVADSNPTAVVELRLTDRDDDPYGEPYWAGTCAVCGWDLNATGIPQDPRRYPGGLRDAEQAAGQHVDGHALAAAPAPREDQPS